MLVSPLSFAGLMDPRLFKPSLRGRFWPQGLCVKMLKRLWKQEQMGVDLLLIVGKQCFHLYFVLFEKALEIHIDEIT